MLVFPPGANSGYNIRIVLALVHGILYTIFPRNDAARWKPLCLAPKDCDGCSLGGVRARRTGNNLVDNNKDAVDWPQRSRVGIPAVTNVGEAENDTTNRDCGEHEHGHDEPPPDEHSPSSPSPGIHSVRVHVLAGYESESSSAYGGGRTECVR